MDEVVHLFVGLLDIPIVGDIIATIWRIVWIALFPIALAIGWHKLLRKRLNALTRKRRTPGDRRGNRSPLQRTPSGEAYASENRISIIDIGKAYRSQGQYDRALETYQQALAIAREAEDRVGEGAALCGIGLAYHDLAQYDRALETLQQALAIAREAGNREGEGTTLSNIGGVYLRQGLYDQALDYGRQALVIRR